MTMTNSLPDIKDILLSLGYNETILPDIQSELEKLFRDIDFETIEQRVVSARNGKDIDCLINSLQDLMVSLEDRGYYRPDYPTSLIRFLVNGLTHDDEDIFNAVIKSTIPESEKKNSIELLASCAAITQLGYIFLSCLVPDVRSATAGRHVFLLTESFSSDSMIFVDFSIDSIKEIDVKQLYYIKENSYTLKNTVEITGIDEEISKCIIEYYSYFRVTKDIGLNHNIHNNLGITYDKMERYDKAIEEFQEAMKLDQGYNEVRNNLAVTLFKTGDSEKAIEMLTKAITLNPGCAETHNNLGNIYAHSGKFDEAIQELEKAIELDPKFACAHNNLGNIYIGQKRNEEAIKEFHATIRLDPNNALAHHNLGDVFTNLGRYKEAVKEYENALGIEPEFTEAYKGLGSAYYELGSLDKAARAWINAVSLDPALMGSIPEKLTLKVRMGISRLKRRV
ncbi:MAG: tetratricopeptide repeat protein [ANME-2 cluster archaeon]|nr:tetratricopeptide repeat protein [ANME-2 cluster archaeon]